MNLLFFLLLGIFSDALIAMYYVSLGRGLALGAALISIPVTLLNFWIIDLALIKGSGLGAELAYAIGSAIGCFFIARISRKVQ